MGIYIVQWMFWFNKATKNRRPRVNLLKGKRMESQHESEITHNVMEEAGVDHR